MRVCPQLLSITAFLIPLPTVAGEQHPVATPLGAGAMLQGAGGLLLILGLIFGLAWLLRRFGRLPQAGKGLVRVVGGVSLGPRERAVVLQVGETRLLVGVAPGRIQTLHVLESAEVSRAQGESGSFSGQLEAAIGQRES